MDLVLILIPPTALLELLLFTNDRFFPSNPDPDNDPAPARFTD